MSTDLCDIPRRGVYGMIEVHPACALGVNEDGRVH